MTTQHLQLVTYKSTGHVLGVFSRVADTGGASTIDTLAPNGIDVIGNLVLSPPPAGLPPTAAKVHVPQEELAVQSVLTSPQLLGSPVYGVADQGNFVAFPAGSSAPAVTFPNVNAVRVDTGTAVSPQAVDFWVILLETGSTNPQRRVTKGTLAANGTNAQAQITAEAAASPVVLAPVVAGQFYDIIALVPGRPVSLSRVQA